MSKHTPGPWRLNDVGNVESEAVHNIAVVYSAAGQEGWSGSDFDTLAHCEANARLIAAAPELYDAADAALNVLIACCVPAGGVDDRAAILEAQNMLRSAIAKATGEA